VVKVGMNMWRSSYLAYPKIMATFLSHHPLSSFYTDILASCSSVPT